MTGPLLQVVTLFAIAPGLTPATPSLALRPGRRQHDQHWTSSSDPAARSLAYPSRLEYSIRPHSTVPATSPLQPNRHRARCTLGAHLPRFPALALLGRLPSARVEGVVMQASEKPAQIRKSPLSTPPCQECHNCESLD